MGRRTEKSQKKSKFIFLIILISALISVTGTYAWFSTQRDVEIVGFRINVEVAENLEISLDGEKWTHKIDIFNMRQLYGTFDTTKTYANGNSVNLVEGVEIHQAKKDEHRNYIPTELLPVSTIGAIDDGNLIFAIGELKNGELIEIKKCSETDITVGSTISSKESNNTNHPYLVFDMYLKNLSRLTEGGDVLQINEGAAAYAAAENTGLEFSPRIGFVKYEETVSIHNQDADVGETIREIAPSEDDSEDVAIWEPNAKFHIPFVVTNDDRIESRVFAIDTKAVAVTKDGVPKTKITDIRDENETALETVFTNKPTQNEDWDAISEKDPDERYKTTAVHDLVCIDGETKMKLAPNAISKVRCYIWLEGQDPDCVDLVSTGKELVVSIRLVKPKSNAQGGNSYADAAPAPEPEPEGE